jgi:hypothetical protein
MFIRLIKGSSQRILSLPSPEDEEGFLQICMKVIACILFAIALSDGRSCRKPSSIPDTSESSSSGYSQECRLPAKYKNLSPYKRTKTEDGNQKVKDFFTSEKRKERKRRKNRKASSPYPPVPPLVLESPLKVPDRQNTIT